MQQKSKTISVSNLARFWANEQGFEEFLKSTPNKVAIKEGIKFHYSGPFRVFKNLVLILSGVLFIAVCIAFILIDL